MTGLAGTNRSGRLALAMLWVALSAGSVYARGGWWPDSVVGKADLSDVWAGPSYPARDAWGKIVIAVFWKSNDRVTQRAIQDVDMVTRRFQRAGLIGVAGYLGTGQQRQQRALSDLGSRGRGLAVIPAERLLTKEVKVLPHVVLYDQNGVVAWQGFPDPKTMSTGMLPKLAKLLKENPGHPVLDKPYPTLGAIVARVRRNDLGRAMADCEKLTGLDGTPVRKTVGTDAMQLLQRLRKYADWLDTNARKIQTESPSAGLGMWRELARAYAGSRYGRDATEKLAQLSKDTLFQAELKAENSYRTIARMMEAYPPRPAGGPERRQWDARYAGALERVKKRLAQMETEHPATRMLELARASVEGKKTQVTLNDLVLPGQDNDKDKKGKPSVVYPAFPWATSQLAGADFQDVWSGEKLGPDDLVGNVVMLVFFKVNDKPSQRILELATRLAKKYRRAGLVAVAVSVTGSPNDVMAAVRGADVFYTVLPQANLKLARTRNLQDVPAVWVFDTMGKLAWHTGTEEQLVQAVAAQVQARPGHAALDSFDYKHLSVAVALVKRDRLDDALTLCRRAKGLSGPPGDEARRMLALLEGYGGWLLGRVQGSPTAEPTQTERLLQRLSALYGNTEIGQGARETLNELRRDENFQRQRRAEPSYRAIERIVASLPPRPSGGPERAQWDTRYGRILVDLRQRARKMVEEHPEAEFTSRARGLLDKLEKGETDVLRL